MSLSTEYFTGIAQELIGKLNRISSLLKKANLKSGEYHEEIVRQLLRKFLSKRYTLKTGYIYLDKDTTSKQVDILLIDEHVPFTYLFQEGDFVIVRPEPVLAAIEIKTKLDLGEFRKAFKNILIAKKMKYQALGYYGHIFGSIFGFYSNKNIGTDTLDKWFRDSQISSFKDEVGILWPDEIFFFENKATLTLQESHNTENSGNYFYRPIEAISSVDYQASQIALLVGILFSICDSEDKRQKRTFSNFKMEMFFDSNDISIGKERYRPGEGLSFETNEIK
jgi:Domain of unknown function (DUF6602)